MSFITLFILCVFAVFRVSHLIAIDDGPADIFFKFREIVIHKYGVTHWIYKGVTCILCLSVWGSLLATILMFSGLGFLDFCLVWLSMAGCVTVIAKAIYR